MQPADYFKLNKHLIVGKIFLLMFIGLKIYTMMKRSGTIPPNIDSFRLCCLFLKPSTLTTVNFARSNYNFATGVIRSKLVFIYGTPRSTMILEESHHSPMFKRTIHTVSIWSLHIKECRRLLKKVINHAILLTTFISRDLLVILSAKHSLNLQRKMCVI